MKFKKIVIMLFTIIICITVPKFMAKAASKPAKPKISIKTMDNGTDIKVIVEKTKGAKGYIIYMKEPDKSQYSKIVNLKKDGSEKRSFTVTGLSKGKYSFKVKAYCKEGGKTIYSAYSKIKKVTISKKTAHEPTVKMGDIVLFGQYEQDGDKANGKEPIEWIVLSNNESELYMISKYALDCKPYGYGDVTWETCKLRKWLNDEFYQVAFDSSEKEAIKITNLINDDNPEYGTAGGNETKDKIFLPSISDMVNTDYGFISDYTDNWHLVKMLNRRCAATLYAISKGAETSDRYDTADGEPACWWWLRSPGSFKRSAAIVADDGAVECDGDGCGNDDVAVRPALIIDLNIIEPKIKQSDT